MNILGQQVFFSTSYGPLNLIELLVSKRFKMSNKMKTYTNKPMLFASVRMFKNDTLACDVTNKTCIKLLAMSDVAQERMLYSLFFGTNFVISFIVGTSSVPSLSICARIQKHSLFLLVVFDVFLVPVRIVVRS